MKQLSPTDYVVYNRQHQYVLQFANGDIILYGDKAEAEADCQHGDIVIPCTKRDNRKCHLCKSSAHQSFLSTLCRKL